MGKPEVKIEIYLKEQIEKLGGIAYKFSSPARRNVPDRVCALPGGRTIYVEVKAPGGRLSKGQEKEFQRLTNLGQPVFSVESKEQVNELIAFIIANIKRK